MVPRRAPIALARLLAPASGALALRDGVYRPAERSALIDLGAEQLAERIDWP